MPKLNSFTLFSHELLIFITGYLSVISHKLLMDNVADSSDAFSLGVQRSILQRSSALFFLAFLPGTFPPARRASDSPMAMACFRLVTFFPERPLFKVPLLRSRIALLTFSAAFLPYLAIRATPFKFFNYSLTRRFDDRVLFNNSLD